MTFARSPMKAVTVVMPVYNEAAGIELVLSAWCRVLRDIPGAHIIVVDDGSNDRTPMLLEEIRRREPMVEVLRQPNAGHGQAVLRGYTRAMQIGSEWVFQTDSDEQIPATEFSKLWNRRDETPFILGWRCDRRDPTYRRIVSYMNRLLMFAVFGVILKDPNVPFRLVRGDVLLDLQPYVEGTFAPNLLLAMLARRNGIATLDIAVDHRSRTKGVSSINVRKLTTIIGRCVREQFWLRKRLAVKPLLLRATVGPKPERAASAVK